MNRTIVAISALLFILFPVFSRGNDAINEPIFQEGDRWHFAASYKEGVRYTSDVLDGNYEVVFKQGRLEVFQIINGRSVTASAGNAEDLRRLIPYNQDDLKFLNFPLYVEPKPWTVEYGHKQSGKRSSQKRWATFKVEKVEQVKTEAGEFQALKIIGEGQSYNGKVKREWIYFYSPATKSIVKFYYDSGAGTQSGKFEILLTKFTPGLP